MKTAIAALLLGALVAVWLTPIVRDLGLRIRLVDDPRDGRRINDKFIPRLGGLAIAAATFAPLVGLAIYENAISEAIFADGRGVATLVFGALGALVVGLMDDLFSPSAKLRLAAMVGLATLAWFGGHKIDLVSVPMLGVVELGLWSLPATVFWIVGVMVAFNFIDGLDGLAAGIALIGSISMFVLAYMEGNVLWMTWTGATAGALLGFLAFNSNPASVFMGDSGSNFLGFLMAVVALETSRKEGTAIALFIPALVLGLPLLDATLTMFRRALLREGMFLSERGHLHHRLLDLGLSHRGAVFLLWGITVIFAMGGLVLLSDYPAAHIGMASLITLVVFALLFSVGYLRPEDLRLMWHRGLANRARDEALAGLCTELVTRILDESSPVGRAKTAMREVTATGGVSGASYQLEGEDAHVFGDFDPDAKGVRTSFKLAGDLAGSIEFFWKDRTSGPTEREVEALRKLVDEIEART